MLDRARKKPAARSKGVNKKSTKAREETSVEATVAGLVSVVVPAYNVEKFVEECLDSLVVQDDRNYEVVIVDDGSTDGTGAIVDGYAERYEHVRVVRQDNGGLGAARNTGVRAARGEFVLFVDSDDYVSGNAVSLLRAAQEKNGCDVVTGGFVRISPTGEISPVRTDALPQHVLPTGGPALEPWMMVLGVFAPSIACARLFRRSLLLKEDLRFHDRLPHEDLFFTYKALFESDGVCAIPEAIYYYRQHDATISKTISKEHIDVLFRQFQEANDFLDANEAPTIARALAGRRTLFLLEGFRKRTQDAPKPIKDHLAQMLEEHRDALVAMLREFERSPVARALYYRGAADLIRNMPVKKKPAPKPAVNAKENAVVEAAEPEVIYPTSGVDFDAYADRDLGPVTQEDRDRLAPFYNKYQGKRCFIIGNGPSLNKHDLSQLEGEYVFAVNSFYYKTRETGFRPTFFVVEDNKVMTENVEEIKAYEAPFKFFPTEYKSLHPAGENVFFFPMNQGFYKTNSPYYCVPRFSTDASDQLYCGQSVTYINLQLAFFMGFTEVYLIGMDFDYVIPKEHERRGNHIISTTDDPNHFHKDYFGVGKTWKDPKLDRVGMNYRQAKLAFEAVGRKVYNATIGGKLEIFPRAHYDSLFADASTGDEVAEVVTIAPKSGLSKRSRVEIAGRRLRKLKRDPYRFFADSKVAPLRPLKHLFSEYDKGQGRLPSNRWAKLRRDPHLFFADAKSAALRPIRHLFSPTGYNRNQYEVVREARREASGWFSWLPASRKSVAAALALAERERKESETRALEAVAASETDMLALHRQSATRINSLRDTIRAQARLIEDLRRKSVAIDALKEQLRMDRIAFEQRLLAQSRLHLAADRALENRLASSRIELTTMVDEARSTLLETVEQTKEHAEQRSAERIDEAVASLTNLVRKVRDNAHEELSIKLDEAVKDLTGLVRKVRDNADKASTDKVEEAVQSLTNLIRKVRDTHQSLVTEVKQELLDLIGKARDLAIIRSRDDMALLRQRIAKSEQQIGKLCFDETPQTIVLFGHHKCASRFFRYEVFKIIAESTGARIHRYEVKEPPFHFSELEQLDLQNIAFDQIGEEERDVVLFANASQALFDRLNQETTDWKGVRIVRDPRQIFVSNYFHHKGDHPDEGDGWVNDRLKVDKPILRELPQEEGLLYELDHATRDVLENQLFAALDDPRILTIKLENFAQSPDYWLREISSFLKVPEVSGVNLSRTYANPSSRKWEEVFTPTIRSAFKERYGQALIDLGYEEDLDW